MCWVFAYDELIWEPPFPVSESRPARLLGYRRALNRQSVWEWGTLADPAPVLGLARGGCCEGVCLRPEPEFESVAVERLDLRLGRAFERILVEVFSGDLRFSAHTYLPRPEAPLYRDLSEESVLRLALRARGSRGSGADYLRGVTQGLRSQGISDPLLERLLAQLSGEASKKPHATQRG